MHQSRATLDAIHAASALRACALFAEIRAAEVVQLAEGAARVTLRQGDVLFETGAEPDALYVVAVGAVSVHRGGRQVATLRAGECVGLVSVLGPAPRAAAAAAAEKRENIVVRIDRDDFWDLLADHPGLLPACSAELARRARAVAALADQVAR